MNLPLKLLFVCTHNRCRSILSEAIANQLGGGRLVARSAGSHPAGEVHPRSLRYLQEAGVPTAGLRSQSWDDVQGFAPDVVITVCDAAAQEPCPLWLGAQPKLHWGLADPSKVEGPDEVVAAAFRATIAEIRARTERLLDLPLAELDAAGLVAALRGLGAE